MNQNRNQPQFESLESRRLMHTHISVATPFQ